MKDVLFLVHRIPYPPNKGDKIRSFHLLEALASRYRVHLGTFVDAAEDWEHVPAVQRYCASSHIVRISPRWRKLASARGLVTGQPLSETFYAHRTLRDWCARLLREERIERIVTFSSSMGQFVLEGIPAHVRRIMDFCDIDSDKWRQYATNHRGPIGWIYAREARLLERLERRVAGEFDASIFVSDREAAAFANIAPESAERVWAIRNGVNLDYFQPAAAGGTRPDLCVGDYIVFTGAMDYWANVEGVTWFADEVWPRLRNEFPQVRFLIVGANPTEAVRRLAARDGVHVTGTVPDVRPYLAHARLAVAPLRIARGIQNKVLEAMAMERPVVTTSAAVQGIDGSPPDEVYVADDASQFASAVRSILASPARAAAGNRRYVAERFRWSTNLEAFLQLVEGPGEVRQTAVR